MDFDKIGEYGKNIKMSEEMKNRVLMECKANQGRKTVTNHSALWSVRVKRTAVVLCILILAVGSGVLYRQINNRADLNAVYEKEQTETTNTENSYIYEAPSTSMHTVGNSQENEPKEGKGGAILTVQKYRTRYYSIPGTFVSLVGKDKYFEWIYTVDHTSSAERMLMPQFIKHFGITREQFDKANCQFARIVRDDLDGRPCLNPKDYANQIDDEIFNGDIIFTFDDKIINEYYLTPEYPYLYAFEYEEAIEKGEYQTRTTDWIDVEQMEAEIIAKYGEIEQVEPETTSVPEETTEFAETTAT